MSQLHGTFVPGACMYSYDNVLESWKDSAIWETQASNLRIQ